MWGIQRSLRPTSIRNLGLGFPTLRLKLKRPFSSSMLSVFRQRARQYQSQSRPSRNMLLLWWTVICLTAYQIHGFDIDRRKSSLRSEAESDDSGADLTDLESKMDARDLPSLSGESAELIGGKGKPAFGLFGVLGDIAIRVDDLQNQIDELRGDKNSESRHPVTSCKDIYLNSQRTPTPGVYSIYSHYGLVSVFCDFYDDIGYTYISKDDLGILSDLSGLYTEDDHAIVRVLYNDGEQHAVSIEQLSDYKHRYQLDFQLSDAKGYKRPHNHGLKPYIYIGFLPREFASLKSKTKPAVQGYRAAGTDFKFHNCDKNPNSYLAFFANPQNLPDNSYYSRCCDNKFMREWINHAQPIPKERDMPEEFYYMYEMHMGGCGGYLSTSHTAKTVKGVTVGLGFKFDK